MKTSLPRRCAAALMLCAVGIACARSAAPSDDFDDDRPVKDVVSVGHGSVVAADHRANSVVSVLGDTRIDGSAAGDAVAVLGDTVIDGPVHGNAVAVLGNVRLGPHADIGGDVCAVLGAVQRDPAAIVHGNENSVGTEVFGVAWLRSWVTHGVLLARPLAMRPELTWAWAVALGFLGFYACLALVFPAGVRRCVQTVESHPGQSFVAALLGMLLTPVLIVLLCITVIGIAAVPFVGAAWVCLSLFGRVVVLAWLGGRILRALRRDVVDAPAAAVLAGGLAVLLLYVVPVLGVLVFLLVGLLGFGAAIYTLVELARARQTTARGAAAPPDAAGTSTPDTNPPPPPPGAAAAPEPVLSASAIAALPRAGFWIRMVALLLDVILVGIATSLLAHFHLVLLAVYGAVMWKLRGSTVGGLIFDLRVVRVDGREMDWETAIVRALGCFLSMAVAGLGFLWIAFDGAHQAWHDKIAGTVVVRVPKALAAGVARSGNGVP